MKDIAGAMVLLYRSPAPALNEWKRVAAGAHMNQALSVSADKTAFALARPTWTPSRLR